MTQEIHPVLLCGGAGTRLWPLSRKSYPKQFTRLLGEHSLFQVSANRLAAQDFAPPIIVTGSDFRFIVTEQLAAMEIGPSEILIEPDPKNTAPAICAAALVLDAKHPGALMLVAPSDHVIPDAERFRDAVRAAVPSAQSGKIVTFGIRPHSAETGYGWLELSQPIDAECSPAPQPLRTFVEKPNVARAQEMMARGQHLWNAGIFLFSTRSILAEFEAHTPELLDVARKSVEGGERDLAFMRLSPKPWTKMPDVSIDYAIMEKADNLTVVPYGGNWSDLGSWAAVWRESVSGPDGMSLKGPVTAIGCTNSLLRSESPNQQLVGIGLDNIVAIAMDDAVLIAHKERTQEVKLAVQALKSAHVAQAETLSRDYRPWGWYESLAVGGRFQVKRIVVNAGGILSLQAHHHRSEHWIVVEGTARVTVDSTVKLLTENESVYIPLGAVHRMENPGKLPLTLIEVQTGGYLGEDDIIRFEDAYARGQGAKG
ncbi:mannose-1-phosphate guanylyltransferase/mannose-6-phosphate isomerase [Abyssibius alkaniclasticus]|uniref:mannose-1-phosphate guanylyltransferase/mannose-6-phosphate isomerase n=1 Tax=Abyssibius alkaniclasticus TaxID=2881234 RepID=UPI00236426D8|nr:mannose-1-phosphate guanylyltransferase/mannose-6-phosphate isomerase [Abyssibius alkaniclasticus]UPH70245.1 mannose-1-phosphate guanylyltransferase/mannose-6-phosphate isomerase [Abyssibius alkaniclasticus]